MSSSLIEKSFFNAKKEVLTMIYTTDLTVFNKTPGKTNEMYCNVCDSKCEVKRNILDYKDFGSTMAKKKTRFDLFICPHAEEEWHQNLENLVKQKKIITAQKLIKCCKKRLKRLSM